MIVLMGFTITKVLLGILILSLSILLLTISYKKFLKYLGKGAPVKEDYCVLYSLETYPSKGEIEFYFTSNARKKIQFEILNDDLSLNSIISEKEIDEGGHILRFNTCTLPNGNYFYQLKTDNQKTMKRFTIEN